MEPEKIFPKWTPDLMITRERFDELVGQGRWCRSCERLILEPDNAFTLEETEPDGRPIFFHLDCSTPGPAPSG